MAERPGRPTDAAKANWATGGGAYPKGDPGGAKRDAGYQPLDFPVPGAGDIIPAEDHNFLWNLGMLMISWFRDRGPNEWADIWEGLADATGVSQLFYVYPPITGMYARGELLFNVASTASGGGNATTPKTDGEQIYYSSGAANERIVAAEPADGAEIWDIEADNGETISAITCDGGFVYYQTTAAGSPGLWRIARSNGAASSSVGAEYLCDLLAANGSDCVGISPFGAAGEVVFYNDIQGTMVELGTVDTGSAGLAALAIDSDRCYVGGARNVQDVWCYRTDTMALVWDTILATAAPPTVNAIITDGDCVFVAINRAALTAGGFANLFCLDRMTGVVEWSLDFYPATAPDLDFLAVDDRYLYATDDSDICHIIKLRSPVAMPVGQIADLDWIVCDGVSVIGRNGADATKFRRHWTYGASKLMMRADGADVNRRPFFNLALPANGRI